MDPATISGADWEGLLILDNPLLSVCNLPNFCTYLQGEGWRSISGNLGDCASEQAVIDACDAMSVEDIQANEMNIYPNPAKNHFTISNLSQNSDVKIMDMTGKVVKEISNISSGSTISTNGLSNGIYFVQIKNEKGAVMKKLIVKN